MEKCCWRFREKHITNSENPQWEELRFSVSDPEMLKCTSTVNVTEIEKKNAKEISAHH